MKRLIAFGLWLAPITVFAQTLTPGKPYDYVKPLPPPPASTLPGSVLSPPSTYTQPIPQTYAPPVNRGPALLPSGAKLPVKSLKYEIVAVRDDLPLQLLVAEDVIGPDGRLVIPKGSRVEGVFRPITGEASEPGRSGAVVTKKQVLGDYFLAQKLTINGKVYALDAISYALDVKPDPRAVAYDPLLKGGAYGLAGGVALGILTGGIGLPLVLGGTALGAAIGGPPPAAITLDNAQPMTLTLRTPLFGTFQTAAVN